jgi:hypothetical protein
MTSKCTGERYAPPWTPEILYCERAANHIGKHQNITKKTEGPFRFIEVVWDNKGGATTRPCLESQYWNECDICGILIAEDKILCDICPQWQRALAMPKESHIVVDGILYLINPKARETGRTEQDNLTVLWLDESRPALDSFAIYRFSEIPDYYREELPDNATFKPKPTVHGGLFVPYGSYVDKDDVEEFLENYGRIE